MTDKNELLRKIPGVDKVKLELKQRYSLENCNDIILTNLIRETIDSTRRKVLSKENININSLIEEDIYVDLIEKINRFYSRSLIKVVNATGTIIHTNLGRSLLPIGTIDYLEEVISGYSNLEYDLRKGERGNRYNHVEDLITEITGAESALVVNNNAGAVLLVLSAIAKGKEVIVSRGELVEIGGSFRIPDVMEQSGAKLIEVGTTNKTYIKDYEGKITENTGALLKVHTSNYALVGFTSGVDGKSLSIIGNNYNLPVIEDLGSGTIIDLSKFGLGYEPTVKDCLKNDIDIVTFSGDKLLGGPQAGIIVGKAKLIDIIKKHPITRALRVDKVTLAILEYTLRLYLNEDEAIKKIPTLRMLTMSSDEIERKAIKIHGKFRDLDNFNINIEDDYSMVGGGAYPQERLKTKTVTLSSKHLSTHRLKEILRSNIIPIITRIEDDKIIIDVRSLLENDDMIIYDCLNKA